MSFIESVLAKTKRMESLLENNFRATGRGLHDKASSVEGTLDANTIKRIRYIATVRNRLMHEADYVFDGDEAGFLGLCDQVITALEYPGSTSRTYQPPSQRPTARSISRTPGTHPTRRESWVRCLGLVLVVGCFFSLFTLRALNIWPFASTPTGSSKSPTATTLETPLPVTVTYPPQATLTQGISATATSTGNCPGSPNSDLSATRRAYVNEKLSSTLRVRSGPTTNAETIGLIVTGEKVRLLDGPICADGYWWWKMESEAQLNLQGWVAGGDGTMDWLLPIK